MEHIRRNDMGMLLFFFSLVSVSLVYPILGIYVWALGLSTGRKLLDAVVLVYYCLFFSFFVALRDPRSGISAGYGMDAAHYMNAFQLIGKLDVFDFESIKAVTVSNTGSTEPLFWFCAQIFQLAFSDPFVVWILFSFIGLLLISVPYLICFSSRRAFIILACYVSTITFFVFQGSGIRQGFAFSILSFAFVMYIKGNLILSILGNFAAVLIHYSAAPVAVVFAVVIAMEHSIRVKVITVLLSLACIPLLNSITEQVNDKIFSYSQTNSQQSAYWQFGVEFALIMYLLWRLGYGCYGHLVVTFLWAFFLVSVAVAIFMTGSGFERYYRYLYIVSLFIVSECVRPSIRLNSIFGGQWIIILAAFWMVALLLWRYGGLFVTGGVVEHLLYSPFL